VKWLRFSIFDLMFLVALVAADLVLWRSFDQLRGFRSHEFAELFIAGVLPMANLLALGMMRLFRARSGEDAARSFWAGFETFGGFALVLFVVCSVFASHPLHTAIDDLVWPLRNAVKPIVVIIIPALLLPQLALALFGGWMASRS